MHKCAYCDTPIGSESRFCSQGCHDAATYDTTDEREIAFAPPEELTGADA